MRLRAFLLFSALLSYRVLGDSVQRIVDDQLGDLVTGRQVQYSSNWSQGNGCSFCSAKPSPGSAMNGTWHDASWNPSRDSPRTMTIQFTGTAIQVFIIGARSTLTDVQFTLDNASVGRFTSSFTGGDQFVYNVAALSKDGIPDGDHTLQMQSAGTQEILILFDYAVYTTNVNVVKTPNTTPTSSSPVQEAPAVSNSQNPAPQVSLGSSSISAVSADPLRSPDLSSTSPSSPSGSSVPNTSGSLATNSSPSASRGSSFASGSSPGSAIANPTGAAGQNPTASLKPTSSDTPSGALLSNRKVNVGAIVGGVLGGLVLLLAMILIAVLCFRRKRDLLPQTEQPGGKHQPHIIPFRVSVVGGRNDTSRTLTPSPSPSSEKQRLAAKFGDSPALLPSTDQDPVSMQQQISSLRAEVEALRAREAASSSVLPSSTGTSQSRNTEIAMLREEVARLQANHSREHLLDHPNTSSPPLNEDFVRELASLRAEMEQLRLQQDIPQYGELPSYSPRSAER